MGRSVYAARFELTAGREGWLVVRRGDFGLQRVELPSDWLIQMSVSSRSPNSLKSWAESVALWWRWCADSGVDPLAATGVQFAQYVAALQQVPKTLPLTSEIRALPGDDRLRAATTVRQRVDHVKQFYRWALESGRVSMTSGQQITGFKSPRAAQKKTAPRLLPKQVKALLTADFKPRDRLAIELLYGAGLREGEALGLRVEDLCVSGAVASVFGCTIAGGPHLHIRRRMNPNGALAKSGYSRVVPILRPVLVAYLDWQAWAFDHFPESVDSAFLLLSLSGPTRGRPWSVPGLLSMWRDHVRSIPGLESSHPHLLRHTFASELVDAGVEPLAIQTLLGHRHPASTQIYTHALMETVVAAAHDLSTWRENRFGVR